MILNAVPNPDNTQPNSHTRSPSADLRLWADTNRVVELAKELGRRCIELRIAGLTVEKKTDGSVLTNADLEMHALLTAELSKIRMCPVVSEESKDSLSQSSIGKDSEWWLIDPIDGSASYKNGHDGFAICISLMKGDRPEIGVISAPALGITYFAAKDFGSYSLSVNGEQKRLGATPLQTRPFAFGGFYGYSAGHRDQLNEFLLLNDLPESVVRPVSAALKYCLVASGELDMGGGWSQLDIWDISAADLIVSEAGGRLINFLGGTEYHYSPFFSKVDAPMALGRDVALKIRRANLA